MAHPTNDNINRICATQQSNALIGSVKWSPVKSIWFFVMLISWLIGGTYFLSWGALAAFFITSAITLCFGHSLGMHRKFIHQSYDCPDWMEKLGVWLGTLVGLGGPFTMMHTHDMRDWAQRQSACHPFFAHQTHMVQDFWWQIHCKLHLEHKPDFHFPKNLKGSKFYRILQASSMLQQIPIGLVLFLIGGWGFVFWGVCGRVTISILGHWFIGYFAHNRGDRDWHVQGAAVQGHNIHFCGLITFGECWHNNHHAFPGSAKLGLSTGQIDPGWWVLKRLERFGLVTDIVLPQHLAERPELARLQPDQATL